MSVKNKIIVILGPTASGKTRLAVKLAAKFNGEIVSADSRQVYRGMDVGTGKDLEEYKVKIPNPKSSAQGRPALGWQIPNKLEIRNSEFEILKIPYHLIDVASPKKQFDLAKYQKLAFNAIDDVLSRGKLPILAGGSGLYLQAVVDNYRLAQAARDSALRKKMEKLEVGRLWDKLAALAPKMAAGLNQSDRHNKRRLIRYLEILNQDKSFKSRPGQRKYDALLIGLNPPREILKERIAQRLIRRLKEQNLIGEVENLRASGLSWKRLEEFGLEYKFVSLYLEKEISYQEMVEKINLASRQFARRQLTWFKRWEKQGAKIEWLVDMEDAVIKVKNLLNKGRLPEN